jgi:hypothetical protein
MVLEANDTCAQCQILSQLGCAGLPAPWTDLPLRPASIDMKCEVRRPNRPPLVSSSARAPPLPLLG